MKQAALVLITRGRLVLSVSRRGDQCDMGLPGGAVETGETPEMAASRELREETGVVCAATNLRPVFCATVSDVEVHTFVPRDTPPTRDALPATGETGRVAWVPWADICRGSFGEYNRMLFRSVAPVGGPWAVAHNCIAHPLLSIAAAIEAFHDWTARKAGF